MLVTSLTTAAAFFGSAVSNITAIKCFRYVKRYLSLLVWKLEVTLFERLQNNTAIGVDYLTLEEQFFLQFFLFQNVPFCF